MMHYELLARPQPTPYGVHSICCSPPAAYRAMASKVVPAGTSKFAPFRSKRLDLGCFVNQLVLRDHAKRRVFAEHEAER